MEFLFIRTVMECEKRVRKYLSLRFLNLYQTFQWEIEHGTFLDIEIGNSNVNSVK